MTLIEMLQKIDKQVKFNVADFKGEEHTKVIKEMNQRGLFVYHIIDGYYNLGGERVHMTSYCYVSEADDLKNPANFFDDFKDGYCYANVVNETWGIEELGSIAFELRNGYMKRVG